MSRGSLTRAGACWVLVTALVLGLGALAVPALTSRAPGFPGLVVGLAAAVALLTGAWLWLLTTLVALGTARGRLPRVVQRWPQPLVRWLLAGCGAVVVGGLAVPAQAADGGRAVPPPAAVAVLRGLPLPDRPVAAGHADQADQADQAGHAGRAGHADRVGLDPRVVVVRPGDSLWAIAATELAERGGSVGPAEIDARWRAIYAANRAALGPDPDRIWPGTAVVLPPH